MTHAEKSGSFIARSGAAFINGLKIVVDDRERDEELLGALGAQEELIVERRRLGVGDYLVDGKVLFERKTALDFAQSLFDGRLFSQAGRLVRAQERGAVILQGTAADWRETGVSREALQGALVSLMLVFDLPVFRAADAAEAARILVYAGRQLIRARSGGSANYGLAKAKRKATRQLRLLQTLPGVGRERAKALLERFGSVSGCFSASVEELLEVEGVGKATAEAIRHTVSEEPRLYGRCQI